MCEQIVLDLTSIIANPNKEFAVSVQFAPEDSLVDYPQCGFDGKARFEGFACFVDSEVELYGKIKFALRGVCDRCCKPTSTEYVVPFDEVFYPSAEEFDDYVYEGSKLDATKAFYDAISLSLPISFLCKEDCKGLCPRCGKDRNEGDCQCNVPKNNYFSNIYTTK